MALPRRAFLVALAGGVSGCLGSPDDNARTSTTDVSAATADATPRRTDAPGDDVETGGRRQVTIEAVPTSLATIAREVSRPLSAFHGAAESVLETALVEGSVTTTTDVDSRSGTGPMFVRRDERYYRVERAVHTERARTGQQFRLHTLTCEGRGAAAEAELEQAKTDAVEFPELPTADREAIPGFVSESIRGDECFEAGWTHSYPDAEARKASRLLDTDTTYISFGDSYYRIHHLGKNTVTEEEYRYTAASVADSRAEFEAIVDERVVDHLDARELSNEETEALRTVLDRGRVSWEDPTPPAIDGLAAQLDDERFIEWDGEYFAVDVRELVS